MPKIDLGLILLPIHSHSTTEMHYIPISFTNWPPNKTRPLCISIANPLKPTPKESSKRRPQPTSDWSTLTDGGDGEAEGERSGGSGGEAELRESFQSWGSGGERKRSWERRTAVTLLFLPCFIIIFLKLIKSKLIFNQTLNQSNLTETSIYVLSNFFS